MGWTILIIAAALVVAAVVYYYLKVYQSPQLTERDLPYTQGLEFLLAGETERAKDKFHEAVRQDSDHLEAYLKFGAILRQKGQMVPAIKVHQSLTVRSNLKPAMRVNILKELAQDYEQAGALKKAAEQADQILSVDGNHRWALAFRIRLAEKLQDWAAAFNLTRKLNSIEGKRNDGKLALYRVQEGIALIDKGRGKDGRVRCREALRLDRTCAHAYLSLAQSYIDEQREDDALRELKALLEANPDKGYLAYDLLENLYYNLGRFGDMESLYREIIGERPEDLQAYQALARFLRKKGEIERTLQVCRAALEHHPDDLWVRRFMIRTLLEAGRTDEIGSMAIELLDRFLEEQPSYTCSVCGYRSGEVLWRCPNCSSLGTFDL